MSLACVQERREAEASQQMLALQSLVGAPRPSVPEQPPLGKGLSKLGIRPLTDAPDTVSFMPQQKYPVSSGSGAVLTAFGTRVSDSEV